MSRMQHGQLLIALLACTAFAEARTRGGEGAGKVVAANVPITAANVSQVVEICDLKQPAWKVAWHPKRFEFGLLRWNSSVEFYDGSTFKPLPERETGDDLVGFAFSPAGDAIALSSSENIVSVSFDGTRPPFAVHEKTEQPEATFSPDARTIATSGYGSTVQIWSASNGKHLKTFDTTDTAGGHSLSFSPDGKLLAVGNRNYVTRLFRMSDGSMAGTLFKANSQQIKFSPDGKLLAIAYVDGTISLWDPTEPMAVTGRAVAGCKTKLDEVFVLDWLPRQDGHAANDVLVSGGLNGPIEFWKIEGARISRIHRRAAPKRVFSLAFSPDGRYLISTGNSQTQVWGIPAAAK